MTDVDWKNFRARDWLGAAATLFALAVTFNAEYEIAIAVHINPIVAYAVPGALDVYVLRALQVKRDVFLTVLAMVAVNAASHLVTAGVLAVSPALIVAVSAIAPLVLWRAHVLRHVKHTEPVVPPVPEHVPAVSPFEDVLRKNGVSRASFDEAFDRLSTQEEHAPEPCPYCDTITENMFEHIEVCPRWEHIGQDVPETQARTCSQGCAVWGDLGAHERAHENVSWSVPGFEEHAAQAIDVASTGAVNVPEHDDITQIQRAWEGKHTVPDTEHSWDGTVVDLHGDTEHTFPSPDYIAYLDEHETSTEARVLSLVPPLPAGFEHVLTDGDKEFLDRALELDVLTIRALKGLGMGNARAQRLKQYLETEHNGGTA